MYILILTDEDDISTIDVINWIDYFGYKVLRINESTKVFCLSFEVDSKSNVKWSFRIGQKVFTNDQIGNYWYRRGMLVLEHDFIKSESNVLTSKVNRYLNRETIGVYKLLNNYLNNLPKKIGNIADNSINKLDVIQCAQESGMEIPHTLITTKKDKLVGFLKEYDLVITKAITEGIAAKIDEVKINGFTTVVDVNTLDNVNDSFPLTLFQEGLEKKWEIRTFYLNGKMYSSAIFSQNDEKTKVDFRHYGTKYANRSPPYKLPEDLEIKIRVFMKKMKLESGSLDFIYTKDKRYVFLEVNPVGQFAQVSDPCNYYLEEKIAQQLIR